MRQGLPRPIGPPPALRIYVYDLPPRFNIWLASHFREPRRWDQSYLYSADLKMHRWLLRSPHRTLDPEEADFFFIPAYLSLGFYDFELGLYWLAQRGAAMMRELLAYVQSAWPYFARRNGADHVLAVDKLHQEVRKVTIKRKADRVTLSLRKVVECSWWRLRDTD